MTEEEKLELNVEVNYADDDLDRLESALDSVDRAIADTGKGRDTARIDTETDALSEAAKVETLDSAIDDLPDQKNVELATSGGRGDLSNLVGAEDDSDILNRMPESVATAERSKTRSAVSQTFDKAGEELADGVVSDIDTATTRNPPTFPRGRFGEGAGSLTEGETQEIFGFLDGDEVQFTRADIGTVNTDEVLQPRGGASGLAAEGIDRGASLDLLQAQRNADDFRDNRSLFAQLKDQSGELFQEFKDARFTMEQFHAIFASLVPIALVFIGALPAAITALAGLAGAALAATAAIGGIGLLGLGGMALTGSGELDIQPILERMQGIFDTFITAFTPLMRRFEPLVESAFTSLENLAQPLAAAMAPLTMFESTFEGLIESIAAGLPSFTRKVLAFAQAAMPMLSAIAGFFMETDFIGFFAKQLGRASISLSLLAFGLKELIPFLINFSQGFLFIASAITGVLGLIGGLIDAVPFLAAGLGLLVSAGLLLASITSFLTVVGFALESSLYAQAAAYISTAKAAIVNTIATIGLAKAVAYLIGVVTLGVGALFALGAAGSFVADKFNLANSELSEFNDLASNTPDSIGTQMGGGGFGFGNSGGNAYSININASSPEERRRAENSVAYEMRRREQVNGIFGGG